MSEYWYIERGQTQSHVCARHFFCSQVFFLVRRQNNRPTSLESQTIDLLFPTSLESQESYLTTGMLPYKHSWSFPQYARLYNAAASPTSRVRSAGLVGNKWIQFFAFSKRELGTPVLCIFISCNLFFAFILWNFDLTTFRNNCGRFLNPWLVIFSSVTTIQDTTRCCNAEYWKQKPETASYPALSAFRPPGFSPYVRRKERRVQGLDYSCFCS